MANSSLVDPYGRPIRLPDLKTEQAAPTMRGVRRPFGDFQAGGLTPERLARLLRESVDGDPERYLELAEDMEERNEHYAGVLGIRKRQVSGLEISVEAASDDKTDQQAADLVRAALDRDGFEDELFDILDAVGKGFSATEIVWETSAKQWMPKALKWRDPRWFTFDDVDLETLMLRGESGPEPLMPYKWIVHRAKTKSGLTIRGGIARAAAWNYLFKSFSAKDWAVFCEAYGQPLRIGKWGPNASEADKKTLLNAVAGIGTDFAGIIPQSMAVEIVGSNISGNHEIFEKRADWLDRQTSKLVLGQTATTDAIAGGHAVGKVHDEVREDIERADARQLAATLNRDLARPIVDLNIGRRPAYPRIRIGRPDEVDVSKLVTNVAKLVPMGLKVGMSTMRDRIGLPDPEDGEELLVSPSTAPPADSGAETAKTAAAVRHDHPPDAIDRSVTQILADDGWQPIVSPIVAGLEEELAAATSLDDARAILQRRADTLGASQLTELLARAAFRARLAGEADEDITE